MNNKLLKSTTTVSSMTLLSRLMGFIRDMVFATLFGATLGFDSFLLAFKIPNFFRRLFAEGAFSSAFVPILAEYQTTKEPKEVEELIHKVAGNLALVLCGVTFIGVVAAPLLIMAFAPGFIGQPERFELATTMLRITFPYLFFISMTALAGGVLNTYHRFGVPAFTPVLLNLSLILSAIYLSQYTDKPVLALAWGVFIGGIVQLGFQLPFLKQLNFLSRLTIDWRDPGVKRILKLMLPAVLGASVMQINLLVDTLFASFLPVGSLSWLYYADRLTELPLGLFGVALATVALPNLSRHFAQKDEKAYNSQLNWALKMCLLVGLPSGVGLWILAGPVITTLFYHGAFNENDVMMASMSLRMLSLGLVAFMITKVLVSAFYARQNTSFPVKVAIVALLSNIVFNALLIGSLKHAGLSLASSISAIIQVVLLGTALARKGHFKDADWAPFLFRLIFVNTLMAGMLTWAAPQLADWLNLSVLYRVAQLLGLIGSFIIIYCVCLWGVGLRFRQLLFQKA